MTPEASVGHTVRPTRLLFDGLDKQALLPLVDVYNWVHTIDLIPGMQTKGIWGTSSPVLRQAIGDLDFRDRKVLDIGCWDGLYSFDAEKGGARAVYATDMVSQRTYGNQPTFHLAHRILESRSLYYDDMSVYDVKSIGVDDFDVVIYAGVVYHLRDPVRSFDALRSVMKVGGKILIEGAVLEDDDCFAKFYHNELFCGDVTNWWVPTKSCFEQWAESAGFEIERRYEQWGHLENQRHTFIARAV